MMLPRMLARFLPAALLAAGFAARPAAQVTAPANPAPTPTRDLAREFAAALPPSDKARWTLIPWRRSLRQALAEAAQTGKPVYLLVNDGDVDCGRC